jgi:hypothetical protein
MGNVLYDQIVEELFCSSYELTAKSGFLQTIMQYIYTCFNISIINFKVGSSHFHIMYGGSFMWCVLWKSYIISLRFTAVFCL